MNIFPKDPAKILIKMAYVAMIVAIVYLVLPKALSFGAPFIAAYIISRLIIPTAGYMENRLRFPHKLSIILVMLIAVGVIGGLLFTIFYQAVYELQHFAYIIPDILEGNFVLPQWLDNILVNMNNFYFAMPESMQEFIQMVWSNMRGNLYSIIEPATSAVINAATRVAKSLPNIFIFAVIMIMATYFMCTDRENIRRFWRKILPKPVLKRAVYIKNDLIRACGGYIKAQGILMCITFVVMLIGLSVIGVESSALIGFIIAFVDAIPVLGTGTILIPWAVISLIGGKYFFALGLVIIYAISFLIRRFSEPKIISEQIGLHPLLTLVSIYVGLKAVGISGMIFGPIVAIIVVNYFKSEQHYREEIEE